MISHLELNSTNLLLQFDINPIQDGSFCSFSQMEKRVLGKKKKNLTFKNYFRQCDCNFHDFNEIGKTLLVGCHWTPST